LASLKENSMERIWLFLAANSRDIASLWAEVGQKTGLSVSNSFFLRFQARPKFSLTLARLVPQRQKPQLTTAPI
jgi:hypothetical protein